MSLLGLIIWSTLAALGLGASALWSGLETATYVVGRARLEARAAKSEPDKAARTLKLELDKPEHLLAGLLILNNLSNYVGVLALAKLLDMTGLPSWQISIINAAILTPVLFVFAETLPKEYFRVTAEHQAYFFAPLLRLLRLVLTVSLVLPAVVVFAKLMRRLSGSPNDATPLDPRERMVWLVREAVGQGLVSQTQAELVRRAVAFRDTPLRSEMTPWNKVTRLRLDGGIDLARKIARSSEHTRLPILGSNGELLGIINSIDLYLGDNQSLQDLIKPVPELDTALSARDALRTLRSEGQTLGVVVARNRPIGMVTMKDLVEPVTGELIAW
jgi:putative hemolysin